MLKSLQRNSCLYVEKINSLKAEFTEIKQVIADFADVYSSAWNNSEQMQPKKKITKYHPCKKYYNEVKDDAMDNAMFCKHTGHHLCTKYCCKNLKYKNEKKKEM